jgi:hypothetical protein
MQFAENKFSENYLTTIGVDFRYILTHLDSKPSNIKIKPSNSKSGILQDNKDLELSLQHITKEQTVSSWFMI